MLHFIPCGLIAIVFLIVGFYLGNNASKKNNNILDYIPTCLNCKHLGYHSPLTDEDEKYHYDCTKYGRFNLPPDVCMYHEVNLKYKSKILQCRDCKYYLKVEDGNYYCYRLKRFADADNYCSWGESNKK